MSASPFMNRARAAALSDGRIPIGTEPADERIENRNRFGHPAERCQRIPLRIQSSRHVAAKLRIPRPAKAIDNLVIGFDRRLPLLAVGERKSAQVGGMRDALSNQRLHPEVIMSSARAAR
jgi:hypothetical protein